VLSRMVLRKPTVAQTWNRVRRDHQTGIPGVEMSLTTEPTREELEAWAMQSGFDPVCYSTAWVSLAAEAPGKDKPL